MIRPRLHSIEPQHWPEIVGIFWNTFVLGFPIPFRIGYHDIYEQLALGWYRDHPSQSRVAIADGKVVGYVLVCTDQCSFEAAQLRSGIRYLSHAVPRVFARSSLFERRFLLTRLLDGFEAWRDEDPMAVGAHAHFNLMRGFRSGLVVKQYVKHIDAMCSEVGLTHWTGQINAKDGRRVALLESYGFSIHSITPNRTLSWLARGDVRRVTVVRQVGAIQRVSLAPDLRRSGMPRVTGVRG